MRTRASRKQKRALEQEKPPGTWEGGSQWVSAFLCGQNMVIFAEPDSASWKTLSCCVSMNGVEPFLTLIEG